jgi:hypothetical protein
MGDMGTQLDTKPESGSAARGTLRWPVVGLLLVVGLVVAVAVVLGGLLVDHQTVTNVRDQRSLDVGLPLAWVHQDQSASDPPFPADAFVASPWDHPTSVSPAPFLADVGLAYAVLALPCVLAAAAVRRRR